MRLKPFVPLTPPKIALVGEAAGETEEQLGEPFVGSSGQELTRMLRDAGIVRQDCYITNVFLDRPKNNDIKNWCIPAKELKAAYLIEREQLHANHPDIHWPITYDWTYLERGHYLHPKYLPEVYRLKRELEEVRPNLVIALGNTACWALLGAGGIGSIRGTTAESTLVKGQKVLPTYHPAAVLRQWDMRVICVADFMKARYECEFPSVVRPEREVWVDPSLSDLEEFWTRYLASATRIAIDVETWHGQISTIGFAPNKQVAISVPFVDTRKVSYSYWGTVGEEREAWGWVRRVCQAPAEKLLQNGLYDIQYLWRAHGIPLKNCAHDTMLMHHAMYPELQKGLGFLGSIYTNESNWKVMRPRFNKEDKADA